MQTYTFRAVSWDDEVGAALDDALGQIEAKARAAGAVLTSLSHQVTLTPPEPPLPKCRDAVKIDQNQRPNLDKTAVSASVFNVGCIPGASSPAS